MSLWSQIVIFCARDLLWVEVAAFLVFILFARSRVRVRLVLISLIALPLAYILDRIAGSLWYDTRPFVESGTAPLISYAADNGFPSDHMLLASTLASIVMLRYPRLSIIFWIMAVAIGAARVYAQIHHPIDVIASALIGLASVCVGYYIVILRPLQRRQSQTK